MSAKNEGVWNNPFNYPYLACKVHIYDCFLGFQGYIGNNPSGITPSGLDSLSDPYLAKRMALERQWSMSNPHPYWQARDAAGPVASMPDVVSDPTAHAKLLNAVNENVRQAPPQSTELMSILQGLSDRSTSGINNSVGRSNFSVQGGLDPLQNKIDLLHSQGFPPQSPFGIQAPRLPTQNPPSLANLLGQSVENPAGLSIPDKVLSSGLPQDPQLLNLLQQQYLLQAQAQAAVPSQQLLLLDKILLLKQQQKQEEQQQLLRQQQLLSQVLAEQHSHQLLGEKPYGQLQTTVPIGSASVDPSRLQQVQESFQSGLQIPVPKTQDELSADLQRIAHAVSQSSGLHLPHQVFDHQKSWSASLPEQIDDIHQDSSAAPTVDERFPSPETLDKYAQDSLLQKPTVLDSHAQTFKKMSEDIQNTGVAGQVAKLEDYANSVPSVKYHEMPVTGPSTGIPDVEQANYVIAQPNAALDDTQAESKGSKDERSLATETKSVEAREGKKAPEKKSRKQKSSKSQSSDQMKGASKTSALQQPKLSEIDETTVSSTKFENSNFDGETHYGISPEGSAAKSMLSAEKNMDLQYEKLGDAENADFKGESLPVGYGSIQSTQLHSGQRAWKPAPGFKAKSLLEIQLEEQRRAQTDRTVPEVTTSFQSMNLSSPWVGAVASSDPKVYKESVKDANATELNVERPEISSNAKSKKSQLHDLLAEEVLAKSAERDVGAPENVSNVPLLQEPVIQTEPVDDGNFIEAKDTKKSRKKSAKNKAAGTKVSVTPDVVVAASSIEKGKSSRQVQPEKEVLPAVPSGPSLGDFVLWKGESAAPSPAPAWSTDSKKLLKPTSLRDIQKEQEKKMSSLQSQNQTSTPQKSHSAQKSQQAQAADGGNLLWSLSASPSKAASPIQINSQATSHSKYKGDDDLFWGPIEQSKKETKYVLLLSIVTLFVIYLFIILFFAFILIFFSHYLESSSYHNQVLVLCFLLII